MNALVLAAVALSLSLETAWEDRRLAGTESLRRDIEDRIASAIVGAGCFASVLPPRSPDADVRLEVLLDEYHEEKSFDDALAAYGQEGADPTQEMRVVATFEVLVRWRLWAGASELPFREKRFRIVRELRPRFPGDDPAAYAREEAIDAIGREAARAVCKAAGPKLEAAARGR